MAVTKALTKAIPYSKSSKVQEWDLEYTTRTIAKVMRRTTRPPSRRMLMRPTRMAP